jgi:hypothetical protein
VGMTHQTLAAADRSVVELGTRIIVGRDVPDPVRYTIPVPVRGLRSADVAGVIGRMGALAPGTSLVAGGRTSLDGTAGIGVDFDEEIVRALSAALEEVDARVLEETARALGWRRLL